MLLAPHLRRRTGYYLILNTPNRTAPSLGGWITSYSRKEIIQTSKPRIGTTVLSSSPKDAFFTNGKGIIPIWVTKATRQRCKSVFVAGTCVGTKPICRTDFFQLATFISTAKIDGIGIFLTHTMIHFQLLPIFICGYMPPFGRNITAVNNSIPVIQPAVSSNIGPIVIIFTTCSLGKTRPCYGVSYIENRVTIAVVGNLEIFRQPLLFPNNYGLIDVAINIHYRATAVRLRAAFVDVVYQIYNIKDIESIAIIDVPAVARK